MPPSSPPSGSSKTCSYCGDLVDAAYLLTHIRKVHGRQGQAVTCILRPRRVPEGFIEPPRLPSRPGRRRRRKVIVDPKYLTCPVCHWFMAIGKFESHASYRHDYFAVRALSKKIQQALSAALALATAHRRREQDSKPESKYQSATVQRVVRESRAIPKTTGPSCLQRQPAKPDMETEGGSCAAGQYRDEREGYAKNPEGADAVPPGGPVRSPGLGCRMESAVRGMTQPR
jgi:hypothetical protein